jgi:sucrose phosphorylase
VYELNISYFDALSDPEAAEPLGLQVQRFLCSQALMLALAGVPGIYVHSLLGSRSWREGVERTGRNRTINRRKLDRAVLVTELADPTSLRHHVYAAYQHLLRARSSDPAFHPYGSQRVLTVSDTVFALLRTSPDGQSQVLCLHNVSSDVQRLRCAPGELGLPTGPWRDLLHDHVISLGRSGCTIELPPYAVRWLKAVHTRAAQTHSSC